MQHRRDSRQRDAILPPPELLAKYDEISPGLSKELVGIIKSEQKHRQSLQKKYLFHYRLGQLFGFGYGLFVICKIFELAQAGKDEMAYTLAGIFGILTLSILAQYRNDRRSAAIRSAKRQSYYNKNRRDSRGDNRGRRDNRDNRDNRSRDGRRPNRPYNKPYNKRRE